MGNLQVTAQLNTNYLTQDLVTDDSLLALFRRQFARQGVNYQRVEWLVTQVDLHNRKPFFVTGPNPHVALRGDYCGERTLCSNPYRTVQNASIGDVFRRTAGDANQMAVPGHNPACRKIGAWFISNHQGRRAACRASPSRPVAAPP